MDRCWGLACSSKGSRFVGGAEIRRTHVRDRHWNQEIPLQGDQYLAISIETRKKKGEEYSALRGFFRQYELVLVVADERDVVRLRTNVRGEDVYVYRLDVAPADARRSWWSWKLVVNGYLDELAYDIGAIDRSLPFAVLKAKSHINDRAKAANDDPRFSVRIREGLPRMTPDSGGAEGTQ